MKSGSDMNREIVRLSLPVIAGMISHTTLNIVDTAMVGRLGDISLAAVGLGSFFILVAVLVFGALNIGTQALTSRRLGENRPEEYPRIVANSLLLAFVVGLAASAAGYFLSPWIFSLLSGDPDVVSTGVPYLEIRLLGLFTMVMIFTLRGFVFGVARVRIDMTVSIIVNLLNILLNYLLIFGKLGFPRLEVRGAALASVISTVVGLALYLILVNWKILVGTARRSAGLLSSEIMRTIIRISAPRAAQSVSIVGFLVFLSFIGRIGIKELAISNIIFKAFNLSFMIGMSVGVASATLVGRSLGEGKENLASRYGWRSALIGSVLMGITGTLFMFFPRQIMGIFSDSAETVELGVTAFRMLGAFQLIDGVGIVLSRTLQGAGSTMYVMVCEMICIWFVMIPFSWLAVVHYGAGMTIAWVALYLYMIVFSLMMAWKFHEGGWKRVRF
jgi:MATE family multidrug resistance protein